MSRSIAVILLTLVLGVGLPASAHDGTAQGASPAALSGLPVDHASVTVNPEAGSAQTIEATQGRQLILTLFGAGAGVLHLHG